MNEYVNTHIIKYAKGHYGETDDVMSDLRFIIKRWSGMHKDCSISNKDVFRCVLEVWRAVCSDREKSDTMLNLFFPDPFSDNKTMEVNCVNGIKAMIRPMVMLPVAGGKKVIDLDEDWEGVWFGPCKGLIGRKEPRKPVLTEVRKINV